MRDLVKGRGWVMGPSLFITVRSSIPPRSTSFQAYSKVHVALGLGQGASN